MLWLCKSLMHEIRQIGVCVSDTRHMRFRQILQDLFNQSSEVLALEVENETTQDEALGLAESDAGSGFDSCFDQQILFHQTSERQQVQLHGSHIICAVGKTMNAHQRI